tara:strand:+ start:209 stop:916 length:708 start_codon:yes stop_codon:yes gene_type:complete
MANSDDKEISVMIAEDHEIVRTGLKLLFHNANDIKIISEVDNGKEAVDRVGLVRPDVILMDVTMPVMDGIEAADLIISRYKDIKVIMLTSDDSEKTVLAALSCGASGYCLKDVSPERLFAGIRLVKEGDVWIDSAVARIIIKNTDYNQPGKVEVKRSSTGLKAIKSSTKAVDNDLSEREQEVLALIVEGLSNQKIADKLHISIDTVKTHIRHIMEKLSVSDRTQAAVKAIRDNIV